ncbi:PBP1A family penicillin-binding protein [Frigidibacter sp. RF13]|uniref:transglycosylase domain-containing protein n=1 Tax=Frigidibacter sp. RF13 TaxID=2997340 RepID=UPI00226F81B9|nr:PBP1A family penicillin-binding protein [Frigidibacter sp. RF13]MCY1126789.1 PBP1A family penicillin-binding protein [Frigidibacter sp. RF13]
MAGQNGGNGRLVADRRYAAKRAAPKPAPKARPPKKPKRPRRARGGNIFTRLIFGLIGLIWTMSWRVGIVAALGLGGITYYYYSQLPPYDDLIDARVRGSVTLLDRDGKVFAWRGETFGGSIDGDTVSPYLKNAVIATEDKRFYRHFGVSPRGIASAIKINMSEGRGPFEGNGGSTITQQLAKLLCLGVTYDPSQWKSEADYEADCRSGGIKRKLKEIPYAMALEARYGKEGVLSLYLNRAYLGAGARGFEAAAQRYFGKSANDVNPSEAAMLAGLLKAPSKYAPTANMERAQDRAALVLGLMRDQGYLTDSEYKDALANPAKLSKAAAQKAGGFFADWVMETGPAFLTNDTTEDVIIETTFDQRIQAAAEAALKQVFETKLKEGSKAEAAIVVMSADGAVRAMVGGREVQGPGAFNRATQALRQPGSTFKPFVYAAALDLGYTANSIVDDSPICIYTAGSGDWCPKNYDPGFRGAMTLTDALAGSVNTATVRVSQMAGLEAVKAVAQGFGFASKLAEGPAVVLGVSESTLIEMTGAYAGILNGGSAVKPYGLIELRFKGESEPFLGQEGGIRERVISENAARQLIYMMNQGVERGTGRRARLDGWPAAGKTGTTQSARDAWFIGFTADYVVGVWMGYDDNTPLKGTTGGGLPAEIWHEVMVRVNEGLEPAPLPMIRPEELPPAAYVNADGVPTAPTYPGQVFDATGGQAAQPQPERRQTLGDILINILTGGN